MSTLSQTAVTLIENGWITHMEVNEVIAHAASQGIALTHDQVREVWDGINRDYDEYVNGAEMSCH